jgi:polysaccharide deacetylase 2 family uncharacterized protein YibQ
VSDDPSKRRRFRPNPARQAAYALIVLAAILAGYMAITMAGSWSSGEQSRRVVVSLPIAERPRARPEQPKQPSPSPAAKPAAATPPAARARAAKPMTAEAQEQAIYPEPPDAVGKTKSRPYEEALPTEVYVTTPPVPPATPDTETAVNHASEQGPTGSVPVSSTPKTAKTTPGADNTKLGMAPNESQNTPAPRPMIAIVIDDMGVDRRRSRRIVGLPGPLTVSYLTYAENLEMQTAAARAAGHELLLHLPMEPKDYAVDPGPNVLLRDIEPDELRRRLRWGLDRFQGYVGVNNHMGSKFTADRPSMTILMAELKGRNVFFLDSRTTSRTVGPELARHFGVPILERNIFLDNDNNAAAVAARLAETERLARRQGVAIAIGHPRDGTLTALGTWLSDVSASGFDLVPLSAVLARSKVAEVAAK